MKKLITRLVQFWIALLVGITNLLGLSAQEAIPLQLHTTKIPTVKNFSVENTSTKVPLNEANAIYCFSISGVLTFNSSDGYFKAVLHTTSGHEYLVYREVGVLNSINTPIVLNDVCYETASLNQEKPTFLEIEATQCTFQR